MNAAPRLPGRHLLLALAVVAVWGTNFVVIHWALVAIPPLTLALLRFALVWLPAAFFVARPAVPWRTLAGYGLCIGAGQFGLLYLAIGGAAGGGAEPGAAARISPGLASLVVQTQVFFTIAFAIAADGERLRRHQVAALALAVAGLAVIAAHAGGEVTVGGMLLVLGAALSWAAGNQINRRLARRAATPPPMLGVVVWSSAFALPPLLLLVLVFEGPARVMQGLAAADPGVWAAVLWQAVGNSLFGYAAWGFLLARHPAASVAPLALGVPVFGMGASALLLGEALPAWKLGAAALVIGGLALNTFGGRLLRADSPRS